MYGSIASVESYTQLLMNCFICLVQPRYLLGFVGSEMLVVIGCIALHVDSFSLLIAWTTDEVRLRSTPYTHSSTVCKR